MAGMGGLWAKAGARAMRVLGAMISFGQFPVTRICRATQSLFSLTNYYWNVGRIETAKSGQRGSTALPQKLTRRKRREQRSEKENLCYLCFLLFNFFGCGFAALGNPRFIFFVCGWPHCEISRPRVNWTNPASRLRPRGRAWLNT
jgi:hypothetical protein